MYFAFSAGKTASLKWAQCGQDSEAYSITSIFALGLPRLHVVRQGAGRGSCVGGGEAHDRYKGLRRQRDDG